MSPVDRVSGIFMNWLRGPGLFPHLINPYDPEIYPECALNPDHCLDPARVIIASLVAHVLMLLLASAILDRYKNYRALTWHMRVYWCSSLVSTAHALVSGIGGMVYLWTSPDLLETYVKLSPWMNFYSAWSAGYFIYDMALCLAMAPFSKPFRDPAMLVHHVMGVTGFLHVLNHPVAWMCAVVLATELSTPFVNMRVILDGLGYRDSSLYLINGVLIVATFFVFRIVQAGFYYWYIVYHHIDEIVEKVSFWPRMHLHVNTVGATILNIIWFSKIFRGLLKVLRDSRAKTHEKSD
ncbi:uncharacterized protein MONBRDRAFT_23177 [Monosiga brevicollis MX1]|uniref:TLC domain-containing protein n=1 Tax=Monosiga brevicollis TaxID=81824 RepID=A9URE7_MONBE|nr:uncharacterized protein MONBRDRAFT_23177 [Monosiga brevicollis MX1]EDQ91909.1 predicted protein [Monosiga brevicollis MX1]|eukprot:XP_001743195.1 hypothetical protein [Monosiga brevicollis MX1]